MKKIIKIICLIIAIIYMSKDISIEKDYFKFIGNWKVSEKIATGDESIMYESDVVSLDKDYAIIFGNYINDIKYKLKVVDENYVLSYESYLTIKDLTNIDKELDVISIISEGKIIAEFIMLSMNEMIFTYKSEIYIFIRSESNNEEITPNNNIYILMGKKH